MKKRIAKKVLLSASGRRKTTFRTARKRLMEFGLSPGLSWRASRQLT